MNASPFPRTLMSGALLALAVAATPGLARHTHTLPADPAALERLAPEARSRFFASLQRWEHRRHRAQVAFWENSERLLGRGS